MAENIDFATAETTLTKAMENKDYPLDKISDDIAAILKGTHKTYKYILLTGLVAKASNDKANPITLQAGAPLEGAYDARSLCHKVIVPFERKYLSNVLGGSNEPFLNKPARFTHLSNDNAVRRGNDKVTLLLLIDVFNNIKNSNEAQNYLIGALKVLVEQAEEKKSQTVVSLTHNPTQLEIRNFLFQLLKKSFEGEILSIVCATVEKTFHQRFQTSYTVTPHKVNQSGASSKEVGDIDIYREEEYYYSIEVKDKDFSEHDLEHAIKKMQEAGAFKGQFIYGPNATFEDKAITQKIEQYEEMGFMIYLSDVHSYCNQMLLKMDIDERQEFVNCLIQTAAEINCKQETMEWIHKVLETLGWK